MDYIKIKTIPYKVSIPSEYIENNEHSKPYNGWNRDGYHCKIIFKPLVDLWAFKGEFIFDVTECREGYFVIGDGRFFFSHLAPVELFNLSEHKTTIEIIDSIIEEHNKLCKIKIFR